MLLRSVSCALAVSLAGCVTPPPARTVNLTAPFDQAAATRLLEPGPNTLKINAFMRQQGGGVVTCAGAPVMLVPATAYADERMNSLYGPGFSGVGFSAGQPVTFVPNEPGYKLAQRETICDAQGNAVFERLTEGRFYVITAVLWNVGNARQGGYLAKRIEVRNGLTGTEILSR